MKASRVNPGRWTSIALAMLLVAAAPAMLAQDSPAPSRASARDVHISFLPPPVDGTISLGIYDANGKLVRVLHRESETDEFEVGSDALRTTWDGRNDADEPLPPGKYHARGYAVGDLQVEGIGFFFNDWISDERPERIEKICAIAAEGDQLLVSAKLAGGGSQTLVCDEGGEIVSARGEADPLNCDHTTPAPGDDPIASSTGKDKSRWVIVRPASSSSAEVRQYSASGELLRHLEISAEDPQPVAIAASTAAERIFLLEENAATQRLRGLSLLSTNSGGGESISDWKVEFDKKITPHEKFALAGGEPVASGGTAPPEKVTIKLQANPLQQDKKASVELSVGVDAEGSFVQTTDGLPLQTISDTPRLHRVALAPHGEKAMDVFQDDGAVVEQFRVSGLDAMMAFDCGEIELK